MSEITLSNANYDYSNVQMVNINPGLVHKTTSSSQSNTNGGDNFLDASNQQQHYTTYPAYAFPMAYPPVAVPNYPIRYFDNTNSRQPNSPESDSSSPPTPSPPTANVSSSYSENNDLITPLVPSSSNKKKFNNPTTARVKDMITRANSVPMEFYHTEFLEYSKETYEKKMESKRNKRKRTSCKDSEEVEGTDKLEFVQDHNKRQKIVEEKEESEAEEDEDNHRFGDDENVSSAEIRRQIHIQSEQKRRAQIKDGFDELRKHLPGCNNKKMSKAALLTRTVQQLQHLKGMQNELLSEVERLLQENEQLKKFQHGVLQRQAMEKMYTF